MKNKGKKYSITFSICSILLLWYFLVQELYISNIIAENDELVVALDSNNFNLVKCITSILSHTNTVHLFNNIGSLIFVSLFLERYNKKRLKILLVGLIVINILFLSTLFMGYNGIKIVGFSFVVFGLGGAFTITMIFNYRDFIIEEGEVPIIAIMILLAFIFSVILEILLMYKNKVPVSNQFHIYGAISGILLCLILELREYNYDLIKTNF